MTPQKRKQVNVKDILKNPVKSKHPPLKFKKEGFWGWLSYIGFSLLVVIPLAKLVADLISYVGHNDIVIVFPFYKQSLSVILPLLIGFILTLIIVKKSPYLHAYKG